MEIKVRRLTEPQVNQFASEKFKEWGSKIPVPADFILEAQLGVEIIPFPGLKSLLSRFSEQEALLSNDCKTLRIDEDIFLTSSHTNRWRFTLAHELGHIVLHSHIFNEMNSMEEFERHYSAMNHSEEWGWIEVQANWFASYLLMPTGNLKEILDSYFRDHPGLSSYLQSAEGIEVFSEFAKGEIAKYFQVSPSAAKTRIQKYFKNRY